MDFSLLRKNGFQSDSIEGEARTFWIPPGHPDLPLERALREAPNRLPRRCTGSCYIARGSRDPTFIVLRHDTLFLSNIPVRLTHDLVFSHFSRPVESSEAVSNPLKSVDLSAGST